MLASYNPCTRCTRIVMACSALLAAIGTFATVLELAVHYNAVALQAAHPEEAQGPGARQQLALAGPPEPALEPVASERLPALRARTLRASPDRSASNPQRTRAEEQPAAARQASAT
ncbi:MAG: hypothetical protein GX886_16155, partial [Comamonadaceae bacterium]|nr:hypothetical protein [Comamonadaceae bacterium]